MAIVASSIRLSHERRPPRGEESDLAQHAKDVAPGFIPVNSDNYRPKLAVALPEYGIPYLVEADLFIEKHHKRHTHRDLQLLAFTAGHAAIEVDSDTFDLPPGTLLTLWPATPHRVVRRGHQTRATILDLRLNPEPDGPAAALVHYLRDMSPAGPVFTCDPDRVRRAVAAIRDAAGTRPSVAAPSATRSTTGGRCIAQLMAAIWALLAELTCSAPPSDASPDPGKPQADRRLERAEQLMRDRLAQPLAVTAVADAVDLSRSQLTRLFLTHTGVSPAARLRQLRVERATQLLRDTTLAIKEIARVCGFANPNHFSRVYQSLTGHPPSTHRT